MAAERHTVNMANVRHILKKVLDVKVMPEKLVIVEDINNNKPMWQPCGY